MGPAIDICLDKPAEGESLDLIDAVLERSSSNLQRTRKGRVWTFWIGDRPYDAEVDSGDPRSVRIASGLNSAEDYENLTHIARALCDAIGGVFDPPEK